MSDWSDLLPKTKPTVSNGSPNRRGYTRSSTVSHQPRQSSSAVINTNCPLLELPTEMRLDVYELVLLDAQPKGSSLPLLQICRQINMEARPTLYKRPTSFPSQAKLFAWIASSRKQDLRRVRTLTLRLADIDLSSLIDPSGPSEDTRPSIWTLYQSELERLDNALGTLSNLSSLTIVPPKTGRSQLLKSLYHTFVALIPSRCRKLKRLEIEDVEGLLDEVPRLKDVPIVSCTGSPTRLIEGKEVSSPKTTAGADAHGVEEVKIERVLDDSMDLCPPWSTEMAAKTHKARRKSKHNVPGNII